MSSTAGTAARVGAIARALSLLALATTAGCTANLVTTPETSGFDALVESMRPVVSAECEWMFGCCSGGERLWSLGPSVDSQESCVERLEDAVLAGNLPTTLGGTPAALLLPAGLELEAGRLSIDEQALDLCIASIRDRPCNAWVEPSVACVPGDPLPVDDPCDPIKIYRGTVPVGGECNPVFGWACEPGTECESWGTKGICAQRSASGDTCSADADCQDDLICEWSSGQCVYGSLPGESCGYLDPDEPVPGTETSRCLPGLSCDPISERCVPPCFPGAPCGNESDCPPSLVCAEGLCRTPGGPGDPCDENDDCVEGGCDFQALRCRDPVPAGGFCQSDVECTTGWCSGETLTCESPLPAGQPCESRDDEECLDGWCDTADWSVPVCVAYANEGDPCPEFFCNPQVDPPLACIEEVCVRPPLPTGEVCTSTWHCESEVCFEDVCHPGALLGETCSDNTSEAPPCQAGMYCQSGQFGLLGACTKLGRTGDECSDERLCYGSCDVRWGTRLCDAQDPWDLEEVWCDGA